MYTYLFIFRMVDFSLSRYYGCGPENEIITVPLTVQLFFFFRPSFSFYSSPKKKTTKEQSKSNKTFVYG